LTELLDPHVRMAHCTMLRLNQTHTTGNTTRHDTTRLG
jgi:hypothetical protein